MNEERDVYPAGCPCWVDTTQPDPEAAMAFYGPLMGWEFEDRAPADAPMRYHVARMRGRDVAGIGGVPDGAPATGTWNTYVAVASADAAAARTRELGGAVLEGPFDVGEAGRMAVLADPAGSVICVWQAGASIGAELVNVPGGWNFSGLGASDADAAIGFYGGLFGWEASAAGEGGGEGRMWYLPGYGDHLESLTPGVRERMSDLGAPPRFEDVVAWLIPAGDEVPEGWGVTFGVADADATATAAERLGGTVLMPPTDMPWVRMTVIRDPQGGVITATQFVPPGS